MKKVLRLPEGFRDLLPTEASELLLIKEKLLGLYASFGYTEIIPPTVEFDEVFTRSSGNGIQEGQDRDETGSSLRFIDRSGSVLALRPDMTAPIARIVSTKMKAASLPLRLSYFGPVYRENESQRGQQREFLQAGVELIGSNTQLADLEIVMLAIKGCLALGIKDFRLILSDAELMSGLLSLIDANEKNTDSKTSEIRQAMINGDLVLFETLIDDATVDKPIKDLLKLLPVIAGDKDALKKTRDRLDKAVLKMSTTVKQKTGDKRISQKPLLEVLTALDRLTKLAEMVENNGWQDYVSFDLGLVRNFSYYSGMVFEIYMPGIGSAIGGGGRYDGLFPRFNSSLSAAGFAIDIERLHVALRDRGFGKLAKCKTAFVTGDIGMTGFSDITRSYREKGYMVLLDLVENFDLQAIKTRAAVKNADVIVAIEKNGKITEYQVGAKNA